MIQLKVLTGGSAGRISVARRFPFEIGRAADAHLQLQDPGVWDKHVRIQFQRDDGFHAEALPGALLSVNGDRVEQTRLRNGDTIECGSAKIRFWLAPLGQRGLGWREGLTWVALATLLAVQLLLIYWLQG